MAEEKRRTLTGLMESCLRPVDLAWLAALRILFGVAMGVSMLRYLSNGWVEPLFLAPSFRFKYWGFEWVEPLSAAAMHGLFGWLAALALCMALGFAFRVTAVLFALGLTYIQLIDVTTYLNHYYLAALLAWLLSVSPAHRGWSIDAWLHRRFATAGAQPAPASVAIGWLYLFRAQIGIVYTFAGLAKAQSDWLLHGQPLRIWLGTRVHLPWIGPLFTWEPLPLLMSWAGFLFDTTIVGWLLYRRTRPWAYAVVVVFHVLTRMLFPIGMFPVIMVGGALVFFSPSWPRNLLRVLAAAWQAASGRAHVSRPATYPVVRNEGGPQSRRRASANGWQKLGVALAATYLMLQLALPLRHLAYGGNVLWHEQGMRFSWRVMLRAKGGQTTFVVRNTETGRVWHVSPRNYLTALQEAEMSSQPDLILQLAHHIHRDFEQRGLGPVEVRAESHVALNGRRGALLIDPDVNLAAVRDGLTRADWVLPAPRVPPAHTRPVL
jgi:vitamin K-dependent gamma-carboxylase